MKSGIDEARLTKKEFLEKNRHLLEQYTMPIDEDKGFISGCLGSDDDKNQADFPGIYAILEDNKVFYIGSSLGRKIKIRFGEHLRGDETNTGIVKYLMDTKGINKDEAKNLLRTFEFMAFKNLSLEYLLINNTPGVINKSCNHR